MSLVLRDFFGRNRILRSEDYKINRWYQGFVYPSQTIALTMLSPVLDLSFKAPGTLTNTKNKL